MPAKVQFVLYANGQHSELSTQQYLTNYLAPESDINKILCIVESANIPTVWSTQGVDLRMLKQFNPKALQQLKSKNITILSGTETHALPSMFPEHLDVQLHGGNESIENCVETLVPVGMLPEFDMYSATILLLKKAGWNFVLLNGDANRLYSYRPNMCNRGFKVDVNTTDAVAITDAFGDQITGIITEGGQLRNSYLGMLRGVVSPSEAVEVFYNRANNSGKRIVPFLIDLEAIQINGDPALTYFERFIGELAKAHHSGALELTGFGNDLLSKIERSENPKVRICARPKTKWLVKQDVYGIVDTVRGMGIKETPTFEELSNYHQLAALWAMSSDYFSANFGLRVKGGKPVAELDAKALNGDSTKVLINSDPQRPLQQAHVLECVLSGKPVTETSKYDLSSDSQELMNRVHVVLAQA